MSEQELASLLAEGERLKQEGLALAQKYPEHATELHALLAKGEMMRSLLAEAMTREPMKLTYWPITRKIVRCAANADVTVTVRPYGKYEGSSLTKYRCREFNMSATIACTSEIRIGDESAIIQWQDGTLVKTSGSLDVEFEQLREARK